MSNATRHHGRTKLPHAAALLTTGASLAFAPTTSAQEIGAQDVPRVEVADLIASWGPCAGRCPNDLNDDGHVDVADLLILLGARSTANSGTGDEMAMFDGPDVEPPSQTFPFRWRTGIHAQPNTDETVVAAHTTLIQAGAPWLRLRISGHNLGHASSLVFTASDGSSQRHTARSLEQWYGYTAFFRGDTIDIELHVAPGDEGVFAEFDSVIVGNDTTQPADKSICGSSDDRIFAVDLRIGRGVTVGGARFCTFWLTSNGAVLTAGHCADSDTGNGSGDGTFDIPAGTLVEFNFPPSTSGGNPVPADPDDQYPIDVSNPAFEFVDLGQDWAVLGLNPGNGGRVAHLANGYFRVTREEPNSNETVRITGCGTDSGNENRALQTHTGDYKGESTSGARVWQKYTVDTTAGNSGSPVIWEANNVTIGIHTTGGCDNPLGRNKACSFEYDGLEDALDDFLGAGTVHVDAGMPTLILTKDGTVFRPYNTVAEGVATIAPGNRLSIVEGSYNESLVISKQMLIVTPVGDVIIGN